MTIAQKTACWLFIRRANLVLIFEGPTLHLCYSNCILHLWVVEMMMAMMTMVMMMMMMMAMMMMMMMTMMMLTSGSFLQAQPRPVTTLELFSSHIQGKILILLL